MQGKRVAVAMSGGVDSSVAAALLVERGDEVMGLMMRPWQGCGAGQQAAPEAAQVARALGIPFHLVDLRKAFERQVVDHFVAAYTAGRTPNPCIECNRHIKFGLLLQQALDLGADDMASGHYVRLKKEESKYQLWRGVDRRKDQSYFL